MNKKVIVNFNIFILKLTSFLNLQVMTFHRWLKKFFLSNFQMILLSYPILFDSFYTISLHETCTLKYRQN